MDTYVKLHEDGTIKEWPVLAIHIRNRGHSVRDYVKVRTKPLPHHNALVEECLERKPQMRNGVPIQKWEVKDLSLSRIRKNLLQKLASYRYEVETGGITASDGSTVSTTRETQTQLTNAQLSFIHLPTGTVDWKSPQGWVELTEVEFRKLAEPITRHVQGCFTAEKKVTESLISLGSKEALASFNIEKAFDTKLRALKGTPSQ